MKAAGTVVKKLAKWLVEKGYIKDDESVRERVGGTARDLLASQKLLDALDVIWLFLDRPDQVRQDRPWPLPDPSGWA